MPVNMCQVGTDKRRGPCARKLHTIPPRHCNNGSTCTCTHRQRLVWVWCTCVHHEWQGLAQSIARIL